MILRQLLRLKGAPFSHFDLGDYHALSFGTTHNALGDINGIYSNNNYEFYLYSYCL